MTALVILLVDRRTVNLLTFHPNKQFCDCCVITYPKGYRAMRQRSRMRNGGVISTYRCSQIKAKRRHPVKMRISIGNKKIADLYPGKYSKIATRPIGRVVYESHSSGAKTWSSLTIGRWLWLRWLWMSLFQAGFLRAKEGNVHRARSVFKIKLNHYQAFITP